MTQSPDEPTPIQVGAADVERDKTNDRVPFLLDTDEVYVGVRPKMMVLIDLVQVLDDDSNPLAQAAALADMINQVLDADSAAALNARLRDRDDDLDVDSPYVQGMFEMLLGLWYARPTGRSRATSSSRPRTGKGSTVRSRSKG